MVLGNMLMMIPVFFKEWSIFFLMFVLLLLFAFVRSLLVFMAFVKQKGPPNLRS